MAEIESGLREFLGYWFSGLMQGLEELDKPAQKKVLHRCGEACAQSYTARVFRRAWQNSPNLDSFLQNLSPEFPGAGYEKSGPNTIKVTYDRCGCDLVRLGLVKWPGFCECTVANLRQNFQQASGLPVSVTLETSILRGGTQCALTVFIGEVTKQ